MLYPLATAAGGWYLLVSTRGKSQAPSTASALTDAQTYLTLTGLQLNLSDIPLPELTPSSRDTATPRHRARCRRRGLAENSARRGLYRPFYGRRRLMTELGRQ
ncbi:hypothetical protein ACFW9N_39865 [Streptomyces sp. NPDC059496]|uniref:hypothetical protein n=1 Tax=Streptomyces sp. NPDC059496 TaxID=3346851 RepID=UPI0036D08694